MRELVGMHLTMPPLTELSSQCRFYAGPEVTLIATVATIGFKKPIPGRPTRSVSHRRGERNRVVTHRYLTEDLGQFLDGNRDLGTVGIRGPVRSVPHEIDPRFAGGGPNGHVEDFCILTQALDAPSHPSQEIREIRSREHELKCRPDGLLCHVQTLARRRESGLHRELIPWGGGEAAAAERSKAAPALWRLPSDEHSPPEIT